MKWTAPLVLAAALVAGGCDGVRSGSGSPMPDELEQYVALGDSYTAGSGIGTAADGPGAGCGQVTRNYPRIVAERLGLELTDASCAGAATNQAFTNQTVNGAQVWPAQLNRIGEDTDLVTVGFGYNDLGFFVDALVSCVSSVAGSPISTTCAEAGAGTATDTALLANEVGARLERVLEQVSERAPEAVVLVVGYPQPVPAQGQCPELSLVDGSYADVRESLRLLDEAMRHAAAETGSRFVDVLGASEGHDICAGDQAWVNGPDQVEGVALPFHPFQREQDAVAELVEAAVADR